MKNWNRDVLFEFHLKFWNTTSIGIPVRSLILGRQTSNWYNSLKSLIILFLQIVQDALDSAQKGRTSITIAHRLSTIKNVDQIYIIENGQIVEHGTHEELIKSQGIYHKLWNNSVH